DFTVEVERSLRVLDAAVGVFCGVAGVQPQSETVWRQATRYGVPRLAFVNKMDRVGANYFNVVKMMDERLNTNAIPFQLPIGAEDQFLGVVDLIEQKAYLFKDETKGAQYEIGPIPENMKDLVAKYREKLIESVVETDDAILTKYLERHDISNDELRKVARAATIQLKITPVLCGSAFKNKGVQNLLDAVVEYLPAPTDVPPIEGHLPGEEEKKESRRASVDEPFSALALKLMNDPYVGQLTYFRVYSGNLTSGTTLYNATKQKRERIGRLVRMHASERQEIKSVSAGDICAAVGLKQTTTGDTLCDETKPIVLEAMNFPEPVIAVAIEPKSKADEEKLSIALQKMALEDPTFRVKVDQETAQTVISGMGELHLDIIVDRMRREFGVSANVGRPQVAYRETIRKKTEIEHKYIKQSGGRGQYAHVFLTVEPNEKGKGSEFIDEVTGGRIPREYIPAVRNGVMEAIDGGVLAGFPLVDIKVSLTDGSYHEVDSSDMAFKICGSMALKEAVRKASPFLLEPIMSVEVVVPEDFTGAVTGDLGARRGKIVQNEIRAGFQIIDAQVPLAAMFGYATDLRSATQGRATYTMEFLNYEELPRNLSEEVIAKAQGK
ncbi:MAG: elongation factor G, partial [Deltaproteobacteria bacterium]|nr:elongation factor G [Deltaproteobacteria bacterium]